MLHATLVPLLLVLPLLLGIPRQDPAAAASPSGAGWEHVDGIAAIAGDQAVTLGELRAFVERRRRLYNIELTTQAEYENALAQGLEPAILLELEAQAGRDLGLDAERIRGAIQAQLEEQRKDMGPTEFRQFLDEQGLDALTAGRSQSDSLYQSAFRAHVVGRRGGISDRPVKDRFVRPGELKAIYEATRDRLGDPDQVQFQDLVVAVEDSGGLVEARALARDLHERALDGEDFDLLVEEFSVSSPETLGVTRFLRLDQIADAQVREFAEAGAIGDYSEVLPILQQGEVVAFRVLKLYAREEGTPPPRFVEPQTQDKLRNFFLRNRDDALLERARTQLHDRAYVWRSPAYPEPETDADAAVPPLLQRP